MSFDPRLTGWLPGKLHRYVSSDRNKDLSLGNTIRTARYLADIAAQHAPSATAPGLNVAARVVQEGPGYEALWLLRLPVGDFNFAQSVHSYSCSHES